MSTPDDKLVARVLREIAEIDKDRGWGGSAKAIFARANQLDPPKTRVDRIMEKLRDRAAMDISPPLVRQYSGFWTFDEAVVRKILEEEGI